MTVHNQTDAQNAVQDRVVAPARDERRSGEWDEAGGQEALEGPVVGPVRPIGLWERGRVVHRSLDDGYRK